MGTSSDLVVRCSDFAWPTNQIFRDAHDLYVAELVSVLLVMDGTDKLERVNCSSVSSLLKEQLRYWTVARSWKVAGKGASKMHDRDWEQPVRCPTEKYYYWTVI